MQHCDEVKIEIAKHYFEEVRKSRLEVLSLKAQIDSLQNLFNLQGIDYTRPYVKTSYRDRMPEMIERMRELVAQYSERVECQLVAIRDAESLLEGLDVKERVCIRLYYIQGRRWREVASRMNYSERQVFNICEIALLHAYDALDETTQTNIFDILRGE